MIVGGIAAIIVGVNAEGKPLEDVARPLSVIGKPCEAIFRAGADGRGLNPLRRRLTVSAGLLIPR
jgi:hypothetical protein